MPPYLCARPVRVSREGSRAAAEPSKASAWRWRSGNVALDATANDTNGMFSLATANPALIELKAGYGFWPERLHLSSDLIKCPPHAFGIQIVQTIANGPWGCPSLVIQRLGLRRLRGRGSSVKVSLAERNQQTACCSSRHASLGYMHWREPASGPPPGDSSEFDKFCRPRARFGA
jgi:hypothetical protein